MPRASARVRHSLSLPFVSALLRVLSRSAFHRRATVLWLVGVGIAGAAPVAAAVPAPSALRMHTSRAGRARVGRRTRGLRIAVSLAARELYVLDGGDTLRVAPVAIGMGTTIRYGGQAWTFRTPRGHRTVLRKEAHPVWVPPEWHYVETAKTLGLNLGHLPETGAIPIGKGRQLTVRGGRAGVIGRDGAFAVLPVDEEIIFRNTLYVPPPGSENRRLPGELGRFRLDLGDGYQLHGTPDEDTIGAAATHGCLRLYDADLAWVYRHVPVGTPVVIQ